MKKIIFLLLLNLLLFSCARVGAPNGGTRDSLAPKFLGSNIDTTRLNVSRTVKELRLDFDEYVMLKDFNKNFNVSPPIKKIKKVIPSNLANKYVLIQWEDTLQANTTYNFNFGNAIVDNNESNPLPYFNFAFSTGDKIDDLFVSGTVKDAMTLIKENQTAKDNKMVVGLYKADENLDYKQKPDYITKVDEENYFELNFLPKGEFVIIAFDDENQNSVYDAGKEKVSFLKEKITLDSTSVRGLKLKLYPSKKVVKYKESKAINGGLLMTFEGNPETVEVKSLSEDLKDFKVTHAKRSDSVNIWFDAEKSNLGGTVSKQVKLSYFTPTISETISVSYKAVKDEFKLSNEAGNLIAPENNFVINTSLPIENLSTSSWKLESDSIAQDFT
ncbi:MAG: Ig-like domain-containing protein, partial [Cloacibacterium normanense]|nr:Ig-like domain-containing protein [Cloacibacterium normanense]